MNETTTESKKKSKGKQLVIVESPTKARTIAGFLGRDFVIESSYGHVRDLPKSKIGIDFENNFEPHYIVPLKAKPNVKKLKEIAKRAKKIILATDEDREGEAIAWHLISALGLENKPGDQIERIVFHEITESAIKDALANPRALDLKRVNAQQARRILDRIVGYKLSPFLWKKVARGLSAGRVQSVTVRLVVEREREIEKFKPEEYWTIEADVETKKKARFRVFLSKNEGRSVGKFDIKNETGAKKLVEAVRDKTWIVESVEKKASAKSPLPPFTTSTLQQEASSRLGFSAKQTMVLAQQLYEGIRIDLGQVGLITYMRTDSVNLAASSVAAAAKTIGDLFGAAYVLSKPRFFKTKSKGAQEAHEAIRPANSAVTPDSIKQYLDRRQLKLYDLIWRRFMATQMPQAIFDATTIDVAAGEALFRANGQILKFDGFLKVYQAKTEDVLLPDVLPKEEVKPISIDPLQHFTEPPPRYTDASLIKTLEKAGVGRPSTYAPTLTTIQNRGYVEKDERKRYKPTDMGMMVNDLLVRHFPEVVDMEFTARMEGELDEVAEGTKEWQQPIREFYEPFAKHLETKYDEVEKQTTDEATSEICEKCAKPMVIKFGRFGRFMACSGFPECKNTKNIQKEVISTGVQCPKCNQAELVQRFTRKKRLFFGCARYPDCDFATWTNPRVKAPVYDPAAEAEFKAAEEKKRSATAKP
ncbi:MAG: type I DNA topoisomerase [Candidatus Sungbacteria bacterium]|uniref:DNA topoisomerase 1 n=1 Tax=Candidatus Sungiibacteriota bacterium TaxID=2750080 RepID=A0A9D6LS15_9BACT|nr:type I DNA topoisomerase [Candidatus Sungbacteria bacterium]